MIQINLLPWREQARKIRQQRFYKQLVAVAAFALIVMFVIHSHYSGYLTAQRARVDFLQQAMQKESNEVDKLKAQLKQREAILKQMAFIAGLQKESYQAVKFLNELIRVVPNGVYFRKVDFKGNTALLIGRSSSNLKITSLLKNIGQSKLFTDPDLTEISVKGTVIGEERIFHLTFGIAD